MFEGWITWVCLSAFGIWLGYFALIGLRLKAHLRQHLLKHRSFRCTHQQAVAKHDQVVGELEQLTAFCRQLLNPQQKDVVYQAILQQFTELAQGDSVRPHVSLWRYDPPRYGFILELSSPEPKEWLAVNQLSMKEPMVAVVVAQGKPLLRPRLPEMVNRILCAPIAASAEGIALIPLTIEGRPHIIVLMLCSSAQIELLEERIQAVNLVAIQASLSLGSLFHRELAVLDYTTHVYNFAYFQEMLAQELQRCHRFELALSLLIIDIDGFKEINDTYGHQEGDIVIMTVVQIIKKAIRSVDLLARYGGDEFVVMLPETGRGNDPNSCDALPVAERIRLTIAQQLFELSNTTIRVTVSIGISVREAHAETPIDAATLFKQADEQLYRSKRAGKNRCAVPDGPIIGPE